MTQLHAKHLALISGNPDPRFYDLAGDLAALEVEMARIEINNKRRIAMFLANVSQETDHLKTLEEYGDERYFRSFLGGEWRYHGRGYLMNTWKTAYARLSWVLDVDLVDHPDRLAKDKSLAARAACWFWQEHHLNIYADRGDFEAVCSTINRGEVRPQGPINGWEERLAFYTRALEVLPKDIVVVEPIAGEQKGGRA